MLLAHVLGKLRQEYDWPLEDSLAYRMKACLYKTYQTSKQIRKWLIPVTNVGPANVGSASGHRSDWCWHYTGKGKAQCEPRYLVILHIPLVNNYSTSIKAADRQTLAAK